MISESNRSDLIYASITFIETISRIYGSDKGIELWSTIADTIDPDLKSQVFLQLLTGAYQSPKITVRNPILGPVDKKVEVVRCIRNYDKRRLGLKEAVDIANKLSNGGQVVLEVAPDLNKEFKEELRKLNLVV